MKRTPSHCALTALLSTLLFASTLLSASVETARASEATILTLEVQNLETSKRSAIRALKRALKKVAGVRFVNVKRKKGFVDVHHTGADESAIRKAVAATGFKLVEKVVLVMSGEPLEFSHTGHLDEIDAEGDAQCPACHDAGPPKPTLKLDQCAECHDTDIPTPQLTTKARELTVSFPHPEHADAAPCRGCHEPTATESQVEGEGMLGPDRCATCHREEGAGPEPDACDTCHEELPEIGGITSSRIFTLPHDTHEDAAECLDCHAKPAPELRHGQLAVRPDRCFACHRDNDLEALPPRCDLCHGDGSELPVRPERRTLEVTIPHERHASKLGCESCHDATVEESGSHGRSTVTPARCVSCHDENQVAARCVKCHGSNMKLTAPPSHATNWQKNHGKKARWRVFGEHGKDCTQCHRVDACTTCHKTTAPGNHRGMWRIRSHGRAAGWDRDSCKTCHENGQCVRCHQRTEPLNHQGAWIQLHGLAARVKSNENCLACHQQAFCTACHLRNLR